MPDGRIADACCEIQFYLVVQLATHIGVDGGSAAVLAGVLLCVELKLGPTVKSVAGTRLAESFHAFGADPSFLLRRAL